VAYAPVVTVMRATAPGQRPGHTAATPELRRWVRGPIVKSGRLLQRIGTRAWRSSGWT
jgi:hypothetical protein